MYLNSVCNILDTSPIYKCYSAIVCVIIAAPAAAAAAVDDDGYDMIGWW